MHYYYDPMTSGYDWWGIIMSLFWLLLVVFIVAAVWRYFRHSDTGIARPNALDIARERYAKGEIDKKQFEQIKKDLAD